MHLRSSALRLHHLPTELLGEIAEHLAWHGGAKSVCSFSRACKMFHAVAFEPDVWSLVACRRGKMYREIICESGTTAHALSLCKNLHAPVWSGAKVTPEALEARVKHLPMPDLNEFVFTVRLHKCEGPSTKILLANASCRYASFDVEDDRFRNEDDLLEWSFATSSSLPLWQAWESNGPEGNGDEDFERGWTSVPPCTELPTCLNKQMSEILSNDFVWPNVRLCVYLSRAGRISLLYKSFLSADHQRQPFRMTSCTARSDQAWWGNYEAEFPEKKLAKINGSTFPDVPEAEKIGLDAGNLVAQPTINLDFEEKSGVPYCVGGCLSLKFVHGGSGCALAPEELPHLLEAVLDARPRITPDNNP